MSVNPVEPHVESALFAAEFGSVPEIDLHGMSRNVALHELDTFIHQELMRGNESVRVIHGRGDSILRTAIMNWLKQPAQQQFIAAYRDSHIPSQQGAVIAIALHALK